MLSNKTIYWVVGIIAFFIILYLFLINQKRNAGQTSYFMPPPSEGTTFTMNSNVEYETLFPETQRQTSPSVFKEKFYYCMYKGKNYGYISTSPCESGDILVGTS